MFFCLFFLVENQASLTPFSTEPREILKDMAVTAEKDIKNLEQNRKTENLKTNVYSLRTDINNLKQNLIWGQISKMSWREAEFQSI